MGGREPKNIYEARDFARKGGRQRAKALKRHKMKWRPAFRVGETVLLQFQNWSSHAHGPIGVVLAVNQKEPWSMPSYSVHVCLHHEWGGYGFTQPGYDEVELEAWEPVEIGGRNYGHSTKWVDGTSRHDPAG